MGKYVLLVVLSVVGLWGLSMAQMQSDQQSADDEAEYQRTTLARQTARTGLNTVLAEAREEAEDKCAAGIVNAVDTMSGTHESEEYDHGTYKAWLEVESDVNFSYRAHARGQFPDQSGATVTLNRLVRRTENRKGLIYVDGEDSGKLKQTTATGSEAFGSAPQVRGMGPLATDLDDDGKDEIPYVRKSNQKMEMIDTDGEKKELVPSEADEGVPAADKTRLSTGTWNGQKSVFYANKDHEAIYRVSWDGGSPTDPKLVYSPDDGAQAILGIDDIDGDDGKELVFADASQAVRYIEESADTTKELDDGGEGSKLENGGIGSSEGIGSGGLVDFDGDGTGTKSAVFINGSNNLRIVDADGTDRTISLDDGSDGGAAKTPPTAIDLDGDDDLEIAYLRNEDEQDGPDVEYVNHDGSSIRPLCGISVNKSAGLVSAR